MGHYLALTLLLITNATSTFSFSTGAPQSACETLAPNATQHEADPQMSDIPYVLDLSALFDPTLNQMAYTPNTTYSITLEATAAAPTFRGFLIQPRMFADDSTVVGQFQEPPVEGDYGYSSCSYREGSVTHVTNSNKSVVTILWTAPSNGTGKIWFRYAVVQTRLLYWTNQTSATIDERPCDVPLYFDAGTNNCVRQCPLFTFGNHTVAECQPFPNPLEHAFHADATAYFGTVQTSDPVGIEVFRFRIITDLNNFTNNTINAIIAKMVQNDLVQRIFRFSNGTNEKQFLIGLEGGIIAVNASRTFPEIRLIDNRYAVYEDHIIYQEDPPSYLELPTTLNFNLSLVVTGEEENETREQSPFAVGTVFITEPPDPCLQDSCQNGGTCTPVNDETLTFNCTCHPAYSGNWCEILTNPCALEPCQNGGTCFNTIDLSNYTCNCGSEFTGQDCETQIDQCTLLNPNCNNGRCVDGIGTFNCQCDQGFTGELCDLEIDECATARCQNGECEDLVNSYRCLCNTGYTGDLCEMDIDYCALDESLFGPCDDIGANACVDSNATYMCACVNGYTGYNCSEDIDECKPNPCQNGGNCTNFLFGVFECSCSQGYSGPICADPNPCDLQPCRNGGTCNNLVGGSYSCDCAQELYTGQNCETSIPDCTPVNPCQNGGTCMEQEGPGFICMCPPGYTGQQCHSEVVNCEAGSPCFNGGTCIERQDGNISCNCTEGFSGNRCEIDVDFCHSDTCFNGGTCNEDFGLATSCNCMEGFDGDRCQNDLNFCQVDTCFHGGTCIEAIGTATICNCTEGFQGDQCESDLDFCQPDTCLNGGTCIEAIGTATICNCTEGFQGDQCESDLDFCQPDTCLNGGTCIEGIATTTTCNCTDSFAGSRCEHVRDFCNNVTCLSGGRCVEIPGGFHCDCPFTHTGHFCETEVANNCSQVICQNNGTCVEELGEAIRCDCLFGYAGLACEEDNLTAIVCNSSLCQNGGRCVEEFGPNYSCICLDGYNGSTCENQVPSCSPSTPDPCQNGTCVRISATEYTCNCSVDYTGENCDIPIDDCDNITCMFGGVCIDLIGGFRCECPFLYTGQLCEVEITTCAQNICQNGGTCFEQQNMTTSGSTIACNCSEGFDGMACEEDDVSFIACESNSCENEGTCLEAFGPSFSCSCRAGFGGDSCENDLDFCKPNQCSNGGTCIEGVGTITSCICVPGFTGHDCNIPMALCERGRFLFNEKCRDECPDGFYGDDSSKQCQPFAGGYKLQLNSTVYYANIYSGTQLNSAVLNFSLHLNNTYYQTPESVFFQLGSNNQFTFYFSFINNQSVEMVPFSLSSPNHSTDELKITSSIIYRKEVPPGEYRSTITVILITREEVGLTPQVDTQRATLAFTVIEGSTQPPVRLLLDPLIFWVIVGLASAIGLVIILCFFTLCCYCIYCITRRVRRQKKYVLEKASGSLMFENPSAELGRRTWTGTVAIEHQSFPRLESVKEKTTAFTD